MGESGGREARLARPAPAPAQRREAADNPALASAPRVRALEALGRWLNARPALIAQRALAARLSAAVPMPPIQRAANRTGLPDRLKHGVEALSGIAMDDVRVHRNSSRPAQMQAHAYAQGSDIHLAPSQEHHLPHEAWHVVQQKQGRVRTSQRMANGLAINDDPGLEREADQMGRRSLASPPASSLAVREVRRTADPVQRMEEAELVDLQSLFPKDRVVAVVNGLSKEKGVPTSNVSYADALEALQTETPLAWQPPDQSDFGLWLTGKTASPKSFNCWQYLLYLSTLWGVPRERLANALLDDPDDDRPNDGPQQEIFLGGTKIDIEDPNAIDVEAGDAIVLDHPKRHVLVSMGGGKVADMGGLRQHAVFTTFAEVYSHQKTSLPLLQEALTMKILLHTENLDHRATLLLNSAAKVSRVPPAASGGKSKLKVKFERPSDASAEDVANLKQDLLDLMKITVYVIPLETWLGRILEKS